MLSRGVRMPRYGGWMDGWMGWMTDCYYWFRGIALDRIASGWVGVYE